MDMCDCVGVIIFVVCMGEWDGEWRYVSWCLYCMCLCVEVPSHVFVCGDTISCVHGYRYENRHGYVSLDLGVCELCLSFVYIFRYLHAYKYMHNM